MASSSKAPSTTSRSSSRTPSPTKGNGSSLKTQKESLSSSSDRLLSEIQALSGKLDMLNYSNVYSKSFQVILKITRATNIRSWSQNLSSIFELNFILIQFEPTKYIFDTVFLLSKPSEAICPFVVLFMFKRSKWIPTTTFGSVLIRLKIFISSSLQGLYLKTI